MGSAPFALSVHHFISSVGADAGFASIIGLAILILLYFAQARETASLRRSAYESAERIQDLEARLAHLGRSQESRAAAGGAAGVAASRSVAVAGAVSGPIAASRGPGRQPILATAPVAPAGVGAPSLSAATKLIPTPAPGAAAGAVGLAPEKTADGSGAGAPPPATVAGSAAVGGATGVRAGSNGSSHPPALGTRPVSAPSAPQTPPPRIQIRPGAPGGPGGTIPPSRRAGPPSRGRPPQQTGGSRRLLGLLLAAVAVIIVVAVLLLVTGGSGGNGKSTSTSGSTRTTNTLSRRHGAKRATVNPATVTVAVLNGTSFTGLAGTTSHNLVSLGYKQGAVQTATDQTHATTVVAYLPGFRPDALAVAKSLKLSATGAVQPVDQAAQAVACPGPAACNANVIVTVGSDLGPGQ